MPCAFFAFWSEKGGKVRFLRKSAIFRDKCKISVNFDFLGQKSPFGPPRDPRTLVKWSAGVRIRVHFSGRKRGGGFILYSLPRPISSSQTLLLLPHPFSLLKLIQCHSGALHLVALKSITFIDKTHMVPRHVEKPYKTCRK